MKLAKPILLAAGLALMLGAAVTVPAEALQRSLTDPGWVAIARDGEAAAGLKPRTEPYIDGGPRIGVPVDAPSDMVDEQGRHVRWLDVIAWDEGDGVRVMVFGKGDRGFERDRKFLCSMLVDWGAQAEFTELTELGIEGISVIAGAAPER